ncbi:30S ribosomal protein S13, partial [Escherichia coli]|nr:30S ribosomal protein S13 [Escherichia coli]
TLLCKYSGYSIYYKGVNVKRSYVSDKIRKLFVRKVESLDKNLRESTSNNISNLMKMGSYRGVRHNLKYPCNGQRTRSNAR